MKKNETETKLAFEIADYWAEVCIESNSYRGIIPRRRGSWLVTKLFEATAVRADLLLKSMGTPGDNEAADRGASEQEDVDRSIRYLELRGKLKWHPKRPGVVKVLQAR